MPLAACSLLLLHFTLTSGQLQAAEHQKEAGFLAEAGSIYTHCEVQALMRWCAREMVSQDDVATAPIRLHVNHCTKYLLPT
jgi:hypothetical protein